MVLYRINQNYHKYQLKKIIIQKNSSGNYHNKITSAILDGSIYIKKIHLFKNL